MIAQGQRLFFKVTRESLPQVKDKYPFLYLERGRLEIDDSSVKWIDAEGNVVPVPVATINTLLLGPGTVVRMRRLKRQRQPTVLYAGWEKIVCYFMLQVFFPLPTLAMLNTK